MRKSTLLTDFSKTHSYNSLLHWYTFQWFIFSDTSKSEDLFDERDNSQDEDFEENIAIVVQEFDSEKLPQFSSPLIIEPDGTLINQTTKNYVESLKIGSIPHSTFWWPEENS